jgi:hypothetical protein
VSGDDEASRLHAWLTARSESWPRALYATPPRSRSKRFCINRRATRGIVRRAHVSPRPPARDLSFRAGGNAEPLPRAPANLLATG